MSDVLCLTAAKVLEDLHVLLWAQYLELVEVEAVQVAVVALGEAEVLGDQYLT